MKVSAIVVTYNRLKLLKECLHNLLNQDYELNSIFVINNNSSDNTTKYLNTLKNEKIIPVNLSENLGGAGGFSFGIKTAFENSDSDYFWLMDDDTMPMHSALLNMTYKAQELKYNFGFLCSNVKWWKDNSTSLMNIPVVSKDWNKKSEHSIIKVKSASFVSILISKNAISDCGLPISEMFIWADDVEYTTRISEKFESYFVPQSIVIHKCATNNSKETIINTNINRIVYYKCMFRNRLYIYKNYYNFGYFFAKLISYLLNIFIIPFKSKNHKLKRILYTLIGICDGLFFNPKIKFPRIN